MVNSYTNISMGGCFPKVAQSIAPPEYSSMPKGSPCKAYTCSACGGEWFREADYYPFRPEKDLVTWPGWPELIGRASVARMTVGVCLCGTPLDPLIGGLRGGIYAKCGIGQVL